MDYGLSSMDCVVWTGCSIESGVWNFEDELSSVGYGLWSMDYVVWIVWYGLCGMDY